ncbi:MAG: serine/threonine-protein phosphatase, partial [Synechococcales cyanobacterium RU_4_20]|nr:serine/threonine-protein phosphatase [Synechococcales cyanobacterium RU_4_20]
QRMGTTLVMAVHVQQPLQATGPFGHEVYLVNVGDSRAYWITQRYCQTLTVDNDVACREVRLGRDFYRSALRRSDAGSLTQALGIRDGQHLQVTVQRLILDEDGLLLLCSDGLSDNGQVEKSWADSVTQALSGQVALEQTAQEWVDFGQRTQWPRQRVVVVSRCRVSPDYPVVLDSRALAATTPTPAESLTEASEALLGTVLEPVPVAKPRSRWADGLKTLLALLLLLGLGSAVGYFAFKRINADPTPLPGEPIPGEPIPGELIPGEPAPPSAAPPEPLLEPSTGPSPLPNIAPAP